MFGYIVPCKHKISEDDYNLFRAYYCRLCKQLGKNFGHMVRISLSYDFTFLAVLLSSLKDYDNNINKETCIANPFKKKSVIANNEAINYCAYMNFIFAYFNHLDRWRDNKSVGSLLTTLLFYFPLRKVKKHYYNKYHSIKQKLDKLYTLEYEKCDIIDKVSDIFAKVTEEIFVPDFIKDKDKKRILGWIGYNIGRWIYIVDALDDLEEDVKNKNYNSILLQYKYNKDEVIADFKDRIKESMEMSLVFTAENIAKGFELLDIKKNKGIIENIIYQGLKNRTGYYLGYNEK